MFGIRISRDQRHRGAMISGHPPGALRIQHVRPVAQPQHELPLTFDEGDQQYDVLRQLPAAARPSSENSFERRLSEA